MAANTSPIFVKSVTAKGTTWTNSDSAATKKTVSPTIGSDGARIHSISIVSDDTTARDFQLWLNDGSTDFLVGTIPVAITAGSVSTVAAVSVLALTGLIPWVTLDQSLLVPTGWLVKMSNVTQPTSGKTFTVVCVGGDY